MNKRTRPLADPPGTNIGRRRRHWTSPNLSIK